MKDMSLETATYLGICVFFLIGSMLIVKFLFDKYKL